jgi:GT2 family glycosyltransferase
MQIDISIVIVNYNVRHFLHQTLQSIERAKHDLSIETWVVDNNSVDDSVAMVKEAFPQVKLIENKDNPGFSIANNQAIQQCSGKYILLLNPDTVLQEDTLKVCLDFMELNDDCGAVGAKMIDGGGNFLPESKRGFPSPWVSFCKATGLSKLFPKSERFNKYHLGYLDENETNEVDVLCGAFMFMRKDVLGEVGLLDEAFFMYGEDIDLSYRIKKAGHKIYYLPETQLIHFKGESTKKGTVNYVKIFYQAMIIFVKKHYSGRGAGFLLILLNVAIIGRAFVSLIKRVVQRVITQLLDFVVIFLGVMLIKELWERYYFENTDYFSPKVIGYIAFISLIYVTVMQIGGNYRSQYRIGQLIRSILSGLVLLLAIYALLPMDFRFSRAILILSGIWALVGVLFIRLTSNYISKGDFRIGKSRIKRLFLFGSQPEIERVEKILSSTLMDYEIKGRISNQEQYDSKYYDGNFSRAVQLAKLENANEFVFCMRDLEWGNVMRLMKNAPKDIEFKMVGDDHLSILGSKSKNTSGELYSVQFKYKLANKSERMKKRIVDVLFVCLFVLFLPICLLWVLLVNGGKVGKVISGVKDVLVGKKTFVGYRKGDVRLDELPSLKEGYFQLGPKKLEAKDLIHRANTIYAKEYTIWRDIELIITKMLT